MPCHRHHSDAQSFHQRGDAGAARPRTHDRIDRMRADDRKADADRLERIKTDIRAMRDLMFEAFQRGRTDGQVPTTTESVPPPAPEAGFAFLETNHTDHNLCPFPQCARKCLALAQLFPCRDCLPRHRGDQDQHGSHGQAAVPAQPPRQAADCHRGEPAEGLPTLPSPVLPCIFGKFFPNIRIGGLPKVATRKIFIAIIPASSTLPKPV